ncbi:energy-coupling factor transporter ATPase [Alteribacillus iranensis]|uniref:Energy-coupling factor transporter ATP-binding protein EcfA2 n=1 Tax=Alteribacillus iranensis TaxID=930128 RepID=A0A1I2F5T3_9BACI|nr:energy-coupling factor transporter ATPase [Alteribacillus iranensis]SFF00343.1 energy-coupling factor transport system ATP-binding protein [Alteribacillus iranensis]
MRIVFEKTSYTYMENTPLEKRALHEVSTTFPSGEIIAVIGRTGSGKSTLVQHINGLLRPSQGKVTIGERTVDPKTKKKQIQKLRENVGMVFQYPEHQLFEETVEKDIIFGPLNAGTSEQQIKKQVPMLIQRVGLDESLLHQSPFHLSGGQMRRAAIAGVLAMNPQVLILDEPTASLDPKGKQEIIELLKEWHEEKRLTIIIVTHDMEEVADIASRAVVMHDGRIAMEGHAQEIFEQQGRLEALGLDLPPRLKVLSYISVKTGVPFSSWSLSPEKAATEVNASRKGNKDV